MHGVISAFLMPFRGVSLIFHRGLRRYAFVPVAINLAIYVAVGWAGFAFFDAAMDRYLPSGAIWSYLRWLLWPLAVIAYLMLAFYTFTLVANLLGSPFNAKLAAQVERHLTGHLPPESPKGVWQEVFPAIQGELHKLLYLAMLALPALILLIIPGLNILGSVLWALLGFWFLAIEYCDYPMGNHAMRPKRQRQALRCHRFSALAFGAGAAVLMVTPLVQMVAMPALVAGATKFWVDRFGAETGATQSKSAR